MAITPKIIPATVEHAKHIAANLRDADCEELWASHLKKPEAALIYGVEKSQVVMTGCADDEPVVIWGCVREGYFPNIGVPWMLASKELERPEVAIRFLRMCREPLVEFFKEYDILMNYVDARNTVSIRWLKYMGFHVKKETRPYGALGMPFRKFSMVRGQLCAHRS